MPSVKNEPLEMAAARSSSRCDDVGEPFEVVGGHFGFELDRAARRRGEHEMRLDAADRAQRLQHHVAIEAAARSGDTDDDAPHRKAVIRWLQGRLVEAVTPKQWSPTPRALVPSSATPSGGTGPAQRGPSSQLIRSSRSGVPHDVGAAYATLAARTGSLLDAIDRGRLALPAAERDTVLRFAERARRIRALPEDLHDEALRGRGRADVRAAA